MSQGFRKGPPAGQREDGERGQVGVLIIGYSVLALLTVTVVMAASSVYLGQKKLLSAADGAAVAAADTFSLGEAAAGAGPAAVLEADAVRSAARRYLADTGAGERFTDLVVAEETGTADGRTARVVLAARVHPPIVNFLVPDGIPITAVSEARARLLQWGCRASCYEAIEDWEKESWKRLFGGSTSKFTIRQPGLWCRLQKSEYAYNIQQWLNQGWTNVLAGAGSAFSGTALREIAARDDREGPWSYESAVEDYELTYWLREAGYKTYVSTTIRAYTDGMKNLKSLWGQRMKWQAGTLQDLLRFGVNRLTIRDWLSQMLNLLGPAIRALWVMVISLALYLDALTLAWWGLLVPFVPFLFVAKEARIHPPRMQPRAQWGLLVGCAIQSRGCGKMLGVSLAVVVAGLAATALEVGSMALFILGGIFVAVGLFTLLKRNSSNRP